MSILQPATPVSYSLLPEVASRIPRLTREVTDNGAGTVTEVLGATVLPKMITYKVDPDSGLRTAIVEAVDLPEIQIPQEQMLQLYGIQCTLADGTTFYLGDIVSNFIDQIIATACGHPVAAITTPAVNIPAVLAAQAAAAQA
jgi:hypothetical protein